MSWSPSAVGLALIVGVAACGSAAPPPAEHGSSTPEGAERTLPPEGDADVGGPIAEEPPRESARRLTVRWEELADPHSAEALIVRTDEEWEELFVGVPPVGAIDFGRSIVVGVVQADMASAHIDEVRVEGNEVVVTATVELPNPSCGEAPLGSVDMMVIDTVDMNIRFDIQRKTAEC